MILIFKVSYHYHCSFQNVSFTFIKMSTAVNWRLSVKKLFKSMIDAFLIVFSFLKNSYSPVSDMSCFIDIYLRVKRTKHKWGITYFVIFLGDWCLRLEVLLFKIQSDSFRWFISGNFSPVTRLFSKLILLTIIEDLTDILMSFFSGKFISEIYEYSQKSEKFSSSLWMYILLPAIHVI